MFMQSVEYPSQIKPVAEGKIVFQNLCIQNAIQARLSNIIYIWYKQLKI